MATVRQFVNNLEEKVLLWLAHIYWILLIEHFRQVWWREFRESSKTGRACDNYFDCSHIKLGSKWQKLFWQSTQNIGASGRRWQASAENYKWRLTHRRQMQNMWHWNCKRTRGVTSNRVGCGYQDETQSMLYTMRKTQQTKQYHLILDSSVPSSGINI